MGLDFYPEGPHFSYGGFTYFRNCIGHHFNIPLTLHEYKYQFGNEIRHGSYLVTNTAIKEHDSEYSFLEKLLLHSDCDGYLTPEECEGISIFMDEYISQLEKDIKKMKSNYYKLFKTKKDYVFYLKKYGLPAMQWRSNSWDEHLTNNVHKTILQVLYSNNINQIYKNCKKYFNVSNVIISAEHQLQQAKEFNNTLKTCVEWECNLEFC